MVDWWSRPRNTTGPNGVYTDRSLMAATSLALSVEPAFSRSELLLARVRGGLAILVVRIDDRPAFLAELGRLGHEHRRLHVRRRTQAEGVRVAVLPDDLVGERLGREEQHAPLVRKIR